MEDLMQSYFLYIVEINTGAWCVANTELGIWLAEHGYYIEWDTRDHLSGHVYSKGVRWEGKIRAAY